MLGTELPGTSEDKEGEGGVSPPISCRGCERSAKPKRSLHLRPSPRAQRETVLKCWAALEDQDVNDSRLRGGQGRSRGSGTGEEQPPVATMGH